jgi:NAD(P)-dependent dehydrogenase (short-subunit alcohol dehydrogenase family)
MTATTRQADAAGGTPGRRFQGRVAIVTGAASGIGRASSERMAREGATVIAVDVDAGRLAALVRRITADGGMAEAMTADVTAEGEAERIAAHALLAHGRIDVLVNAVGGSTIVANSSRPIEALSLDEWRALVDFNLAGTFAFTAAVVPAMKTQRRGKIVNVSSIAGRGVSLVSSSAYATAKGGIIALTRKLSFELGPFGINCNAIAPGVTLTERVAPIWEARSDAEREEILANIPMRRMPRAEDQAGVVAFLASDDADFVNGATIDVAGGQR